MPILSSDFQFARQGSTSSWIYSVSFGLASSFSSNNMLPSSAHKEEGRPAIAGAADGSSCRVAPAAAAVAAAEPGAPILSLQQRGLVSLRHCPCSA